MKILDHAILAPLVRGIFLNAAGMPRVVLPDGNPAAIPAEAQALAFKVDLGDSAARSGAEDDESEGRSLDEVAAARALSEAYAAWTFDRAPSGVDAEGPGAAAAIALPSLVIVVAGEESAAYWTGADLDEAARRAREGDASVWRVAAPSARAAAEAGSALSRSRVVDGRIALVTGGAQGFGEQIVRGLVASGATTFVADLNIEGARALADALNADAGRTLAIPLTVNVADEASVEAAFRTVAETVGGIDLCVSNAGVLKAASVLEQDVAAFKFVTDVNYTGFLIIAKHCGRLLRRQHRTAPAWRTDIVQINSKSGLEGSNKNGAYAGGKFGGIGLVQSFALELVEYGIKVNAICPGNFFDGPLWSHPEKGLFVQYLRAGKVPGARTVADVKAFYEAKVPMKRGCGGADVMRALYYIVEQEYETGQAVPVTGGQVMLH